MLIFFYIFIWNNFVFFFIFYVVQEVNIKIFLFLISILEVILPGNKNIDTGRRNWLYFGILQTIGNVGNLKFIFLLFLWGKYWSLFLMLFIAKFSMLCVMACGSWKSFNLIMKGGSCCQLVMLKWPYEPYVPGRAFLTSIKNFMCIGDFLKLEDGSSLKQHFDASWILDIGLFLSSI